MITFLNGTAPLLVSTKGVAVNSKPKHGLQLVDRPDAGRRTVAVRFVHYQHQVVQAGKVIEITFADILREPLDLGRLPAADFAELIFEMLKMLTLHWNTFSKSGPAIAS